MKKKETDARQILNQLGALSSELASCDGDCFQHPLDFVHNMGFHVSVLYRIINTVEKKLHLEVARLHDPYGKRPDLVEGMKIGLSLDTPERIFINEIRAFKNRKISWENVPGKGCDMVGFVYLPENFGGGYLFGGDYFGPDSGIKDYEACACEVVCNLLSTILMKKQFEDLAINDSLTGLLNSRSIKAEAAKVFNRLKRKINSSAIAVLCDIDHFKKINDTYGHVQGDVVLEEVGGIFSDSIREDFDVAGRYGGEEFLLVFEETDVKKAFNIVERIRLQVEKNRFRKIDKRGLVLPDDHIELTLSFGIAVAGEGMGMENVSQWIACADEALYRSKENGRNRVTVWEG